MEESKAGSAQETELFSWQYRVQWEIRSLDAVAASCGEEYTSFEAECLPEHLLVRVLLPSGDVLRVAESMLVECCKALRAQAADLTGRILWLSYQPQSAEWMDNDVERFFSTLLQHHFGSMSIVSGTMLPSYGALIHALDVQVAMAPFIQRAENAIAFENISFSTRLHWIGGYQLLVSDWKRHSVRCLFRLENSHFQEILQPDNRARLFEAFDHGDILQVAHQRWCRGVRQIADSVRKKPRTAAASNANAETFRVVNNKVVLPGAGVLQPHLQLKIVISDELTMICNYTVLQVRSVFIREAHVEEDGAVATMYLPYAATFPPNEVQEFFSKVSGGKCFTSADTGWKLSWVHLADHLQMPRVLDAAASWLWSAVQCSNLVDWLAITRLQSMQQRRPRAAHNTLTSEDVRRVLESKGVSSASLAEAVESLGFALVEAVGGMDSFLDLLHARPFWM